MPSLLDDYVIAALRALRQRGERMIDSADVYQELVTQGIRPMDGQLGAVFAELAESEKIQVSHYMDVAGTPRHGVMIITIVQL